MNIKEYKKQIINFIYNLYKYQEVTTAETYNFLQTYCDYILMLNNINPKEYKVDIHLLKLLEENELAWMSDDEKDPTHYEIYLNASELKAKDSSELDNIFLTMLHFGHEMKHVLQYINTPLIANELDLQHTLIENKIYSTVLGDKIPNNEKTKFVRTMNKHTMVLGLNTYTEKEADKFCYKCILDILYSALNNTNDYDFMNFVLDYIEKIEKDRKFRIELYRIRQDQDKQIRRKLQKKYGVDKETLYIP